MQRRIPRKEGKREGGRERALQVATRVIMKRSKHSPSLPPARARSPLPSSFIIRDGLPPSLFRLSEPLRACTLALHPSGLLAGRESTMTSMNHPNLRLLELCTTMTCRKVHSKVNLNLRERTTLPIWPRNKGTRRVLKGAKHFYYYRARLKGFGHVW